MFIRDKQHLCKTWVNFKWPYLQYMHTFLDSPVRGVMLIRPIRLLKVKVPYNKAGILPLKR